jgi:hypothetical protein
MIIGIDYDNTIVCYDALFWQVARERDLIPETVPVSKDAVRDHLRRCELEQTWIEMQGLVYGSRMDEAVAAPGVETFFEQCAARSVPLFIISHKTRHPFAGPRYDLHQAARNWLELHGFFDRWIAPERVFFELTQAEKLARIARQGCTVFIDDLPEIFLNTAFPPQTNRILYDSANRWTELADSGIARLNTWQQIGDHVLS